MKEACRLTYFGPDRTAPAELAERFKHGDFAVETFDPADCGQSNDVEVAVRRLDRWREALPGPKSRPPPATTARPPV